MGAKATTTANTAPPSKRAATTKKGAETSVGFLTEGIKHGQFFHAKAFAITKGQKRPKKGGGKRTGKKKADIRSIIGELLRPSEQPHFYRHLISQGLTPKPPIWLGSDDLVKSDKELWSYYEELKEKASKIKHMITPEKGKPYKRKQAKSETILGTAILSWPGPYDPNNPEQARWIELCVQWLQERYGKRLVCIALHHDEPQCHIHGLFDSDGRNVKHLLEGPAALAAAEAKGVRGRALREAHDDAWRVVQDDFQAKVGRYVGLGRKGEKPEPRVDMSTAHRRKAKKESAEAEAMLDLRKRQTIKTIGLLQSGRLAKTKARRLVDSGDLRPELYEAMFGQRYDPFGTSGTGGVTAPPVTAAAAATAPEPAPQPIAFDPKNPMAAFKPATKAGAPQVNRTQLAALDDRIAHAKQRIPRLSSNS